LAKGVPDLGGLHVLGTERHESRRIDRQLRGRCARQGDPGSSHFFLSLEDDLMRRYGNSEKMTGMLQKVGMEEDEEISHPLLNRSIESAQKRVEQHHYQIRRRTLEYDDVMNKQREQLYGFRNNIINGDDVRDVMFDVVEDVIVKRVESYMPQGFEGEEIGYDYTGLAVWVNQTFPVGLGEEELKQASEQASETPPEGSMYDGLTREQYALCHFIFDAVQEVYRVKIKTEDPEALVHVERRAILVSIDRLWREHLYAMDGLRQSVHLRSYGQKDPLVEYKTEARDMFMDLMENIREEVCHNIFRNATSLEAAVNLMRSLSDKASTQMANALGLDPSITQAGNIVSEVNAEVSGEQGSAAPRPVRSGPKVGRNDPCPCGSGKKYKKCWPNCP